VCQANVRNFVRHHRRQLMLGPRLHDQPPVNADKATGQRKRVYRIVAHDKKSIIPYPVIDPRQQAEPEIVDVAIQQRISLDQPTGKNPFINRTAQPLFTLDIQ
jgi:hypothetical protein